MRPIDADKVLETMRSNMDMQELYLPTHFIDLVIEDMPTIEVEPVKHAQWIRKHNSFPQRYFCTNCGEGAVGRFAFCPNCGYKMGVMR